MNRTPETRHMPPPPQTILCVRLCTGDVLCSTTLEPDELVDEILSQMPMEHVLFARRHPAEVFRCKLDVLGKGGVYYLGRHYTPTELVAEYILTCEMLVYKSILN